MVFPSQGMLWPCCSIGSVAVDDDDTTFSLAVHTCIFGSAVFIGPCGACVAIYRCDTSVSKTPVYTFGIEVPT